MSSKISELKAPVAVATSAPTVTVNKVAFNPLTPEQVRLARISSGRCWKCGKPVLKPDTTGEGSTCADHEGHERETANIASVVPEGWLRMSKVCRALELLKFSTGEIVKACGGDLCTEPVLDEIFRVTYVGHGKWLDPRVLTEGPSLLKGKSVVAVSKKVGNSLAENILAEGTAKASK